MWWNNQSGTPDTCSGTFVSGGGNLFDTPQADCPALSLATDKSGVADPLLGDLLDNGGPTRTMLPLVGSPAIDNGVPGACPAVDQRGLPRLVGGTCDVGAAETQP